MGYTGEADSEPSAVISAHPIPFAVQIGDRFQLVTPAAGEWLGVPADVLTDQRWSVPFTPTEASRIEQSGLRTAREDGEWGGVVHPRTSNAANDGVPVQLWAAGSDTVVWTFGDTVSRSASGPSEPTGEPAAATHTGDDGDGRPDADLRPDARFLGDVVDALDDVLYVLDENADFVYWNQAACDRFGYDHAEMAEIDLGAFVAEESPTCLPIEPESLFELRDRQSVELVTRNGETIPHELHGVTYRDESTGDRYRVGIARDVSDRCERERALERQRHELELLEEITALVLDTIQEAVDSESRERIETTVCDRLADSSSYEFAWIGRRTGEDSEITPWVTAPEGRDDIAIGSVGADDPAARALDDCRVEVDAISESAVRPRGESATEDATVAAVPIHHADAVYGVLVVCTDRSSAFGSHERRNLRTLGRTVGCLIDATQNRRLLFADGVVELAFGLAAGESVLGRLATDCSCEVSLCGTVASDDRWLLYLEVVGASPAAVVSAAESDARVDRARVVSTVDQTTRVELVLDEGSLLHVTTEVGGTVRDASAEPTGGRLVVDVPAGADVRDVVDQFTAAYPGADLAARRERDRSVTDTGSPDDVLGRLTDRQRAVIEAAYQAGYYEWPRESTAEDIAEAFDICPSTVHAHLRKAEDAIFEVLLGE